MTELLSESMLAEIETRVAASTNGPWVSYIEGRDHLSGSSFIMTGKGALRGDDIEISGATTADQDFIAAARQDVPRLIAEIRLLHKMLAQTGA